MPAQLSTAPAIDSLPRDKALLAMLESHVAAARAVALATAQIDAAATLLAETVQAGGTLLYAAAGSSGLMALADASELTGTFGIPQSQIRVAMAGGVPVDGHMPGDTEDGTAAGVSAAQGLSPGDIAIVLSASGSTPYACALAAEAQSRGNKVIAIANVAGSPLLGLADIAIAIPTAPEVLDGSTRLGAGTAQKIALNMMSTQAGILLGHVHDGMMVNLNPDNMKLRKRARQIVCRIAHVDSARAEQALAEAGHDTKRAVLLARGTTLSEASALLQDNNHRLSDCLAVLDRQ